MKDINIISSLFVFAVSLIFLQSATAQKTDEGKILSYKNYVRTKKTVDLISNTVRGNGAEILTDDDQIIFITIGEPAISIMKNSSETDDGEFWYLTITNRVNENDREDIISEETEPQLPKEFALSQNYPNPFNPSTTIKFQLPAKNGLQPIQTTLRIYDILGRLVRTLVDEDLAPGIYSKHWSGQNDDGVRISSGVYFYSITAGDFRKTKKMLLLK